MVKKTEKVKTGKTVKKGAAAKTGGKTNKTDKKDAGWESLAGELRSLIPRLDSEGLAFLVEQAKVHLYNMQVDKLNEAAVAADTAAAKVAGVKRGQKGSKTVDETFRIDGTESGSSYYLRYRNNELMFSRNEMIHLVKMAKAEGTDLEIRERLYNWFDRERKDAFSVIPMADKFDNHLKALVAFLRENFNIRGS